MKISKLEKILINVLSPFEAVLNLIPYVHIGGIKSLGIKENRFKDKLIDYKRLINSLEKRGYDERIAAPYMKCPNGRIQIKLAIKRHLIPKESYNLLKERYPYEMRVS